MINSDQNEEAVQCSIGIEYTSSNAYVHPEVADAELRVGTNAND
jgi:hypothetical protein